MKDKNFKKGFALFFCFIFVMFFALAPIQVKADDGADFSSLLTDGKLVVPSIAPDSVESAWHILGEYIYNLNMDYSIDISECTNNYTRGILYYHQYMSDEDSRTVDIVYSYDEATKDSIMEYINKIPEGKTQFSVRDMEIVNFWINRAITDEDNFSNYSSELKSYVDYKNFEFDVRMGEDSEFLTSRGGYGDFSYNDTLYCSLPEVNVLAQHILYVPTDANTDPDSLVSTIQSRIDNYAGEGKVTVAYGGDILHYYTDYFSIPGNEGYATYFWQEYDNEEGNLYFLHQAIGDYYFTAEIGETTYMFIIVNDSSKMYAPDYLTSDLLTDIIISSDSGTIPLDTLINVNKLTSGEQYDKISKILNIADSEMFDLKLYSDSLEDYITQLEDGSFNVKIPIAEKFKGKELIIYYVNDNNETVEYPVTIEGDYAVFNTNHFSVYTLAEKAISPKTADNSMYYVFLFGISAIGIACCGFGMNRRRKLS